MGRLQSLNTSFIVSTEGCPNLESQGAKDVELTRNCIYNRSIIDSFYRIQNRIWRCSEDRFWNIRWIGIDSDMRFEWQSRWLKKIKELVKAISTNQHLKQDLFRDLRFDQAKLRMKLKKHKLSIQNWLTLIKFLVIEGTNIGLLRTRGIWELRGVLKEVTPEELMFNPWPFPIIIWSGPTKGVICWIFRETLVTWWAPESGYQFWDEED